MAAFTIMVVASHIASPNVKGDWEKCCMWYRLDGAWLRSTVVENEPGAPPHSFVIFSPKGLLAREAAFRGTFLDPDPALIPPGGHVTDFFGEAVMTGPSTYKATAYAYIMMPNPGGGRDLVAFIIIATGSGTFLSENVVQGTTAGSVYLGSTDADGDLLPDDPDDSLFSIPSAPFVDNRTPMVP